MSKILTLGVIAALVFSLAGTASADVVNVALGKVTTQSTDGFGFTGAPAVDGLLNNFTHTDSGDLAPFWQVDLGEEFLVEGINFYNRENCCGERLYNLTFEILDAADAVVYTAAQFNPWDGATPVDPPNPGLGAFSIDLTGEPFFTVFL